MKNTVFSNIKPQQCFLYGGKKHQKKAPFPVEGVKRPNNIANAIDEKGEPFCFMSTDPVTVI